MLTLEGCLVNAKDYWNIFLETGAPEMYLLFQQARRMEEIYVPDDQRSGAAGVGLQ